MDEFEKPKWNQVRAAIQKQFDGRRKEVRDTIDEQRQEHIERLDKELPGAEQKEERDASLEQIEISLQERLQRQLEKIEHEQQERLRREMKFFDRER